MFPSESNRRPFSSSLRSERRPSLVDTVWSLDAWKSAPVGRPICGDSPNQSGCDEAQYANHEQSRSGYDSWFEGPGGVPASASLKQPHPWRQSTAGSLGEDALVRPPRLKHGRYVSGNKTPASASQSNKGMGPLPATVHFGDGGHASAVSRISAGENGILRCSHKASVYLSESAVHKNPVPPSDCCLSSQCEMLGTHAVWSLGRCGNVKCSTSDFETFRGSQQPARDVPPSIFMPGCCTR